MVQQGKSLIFAADGRQLSFVVPTSYETGDLYVWDVNGASAPRLLASQIDENVQMGSFSPDGRHLLVVDTNRSVVTLDAATGNHVGSFPTIGRAQEWSRTMKVCLSPDGTKLAFSSPSNLGVDTWDPKTGRLLFSLPEEHGTVYWLAWSPDSQRLAVSRSNGDIAIWNLPEIERVLAGLGLGQ